MKRLLFTFLLIIPAVITISRALAQKAPAKPLTVKELSFSRIFGIRNNDSTNMYCLLGSGFLKAPRSKNADSLIRAWIRRHPKAVVVLVSSFGPVMADNPTSKITYCWLVDGRDTINNYLVRRGAFPGSTMQRPKTWEELSKEEQTRYGSKSEMGLVQVLIGKKAYSAFLQQIAAAEQEAVTRKLGVYAGQ